MKFFNLSEPIEYEALMPGRHNRWGNDALLFRVNKGTGKLTTKYGTDKSGDTYGFLLLDNKPLINSYGEELYCPTCAKVLSMGLGRENVNQSLIDTIKHSQNVGNDIKVAFENIKPMLSILEDGYYLLTRIEMIPTDGEGNFFWNLPSSKKLYKATADVYYKFHISSGTPKFLLPSQSIACLNKERVSHYVDQLNHGKSMTGLAYYYEGFMSTLLDGHHRATAAYIENKSIDCLTIVKVTGLGFNQDKKPDKIYAGGEIYDFNLFSKPERIYKYLKKIMDSRKWKLETQEVEELLSACQCVWIHETATTENDFGKRIYPDYLSIAFSDMAGDVSDERVHDVMGRRDEEAEFELEMIFKKLELQEPKRAIELAKRIINDANWKVLLEEAFRYLASIDSTEVEDIFIKYLIDTDHDPKDVCRKIAHEYLNNR
ncbi:hypothetical protein MJA45_23795 [Paenibacillus aurantius]|uniref:Uncharacterized protein n=1 Tax=Paenibacillus aurantius TaxID=2918900 RepID=A0AA96LEG6_9BACL|nr:hypothetical protein [Paenibacillus aurantius]WNQ10610.1 hypothetical protein MJA45_23795 [Paenibacillus aurantius]